MNCIFVSFRVCTRCNGHVEFALMLSCLVEISKKDRLTDKETNRQTIYMYLLKR